MFKFICGNCFKCLNIGLWTWWTSSCFKKIATKFEEKTGEKVTIVAGPTSKWIDKAKKDADIIFSGNTSMMDGFIKALPEQIKVDDIEV
nr:substrate-binding domain-containing protein [Campylobacter insulaenigrae]